MNITKVYKKTFIIPQPVAKPITQAVVENKKLITPNINMPSLEDLLEGEILDKNHEKSILKKTRKFLKRSFSKSMRYLTL